MASILNTLRFLKKHHFIIVTIQ
ncbi:CPXV166 protein [Cowpox virus]|uniref:CPXV166 protein n=1 Tax=Cowpox virus TaxID=10243 RepID=U5TG22_COWPX|nr:CPXV166 protein [Cowpox virus]